MTDDNAENDTNTILIFGLALVGVLIILVLVLLLVLLVFVSVILFLPDQGGYLVSCGEYEGEMSTGEKFREEWIISDNITRYEDISQSQRDNLSNNTIEILKDADSLFDAIDYTEMSATDKEIFKKALNSSVRVKATNRPHGRVIYRGKVYSCDVTALEDA